MSKPDSPFTRTHLIVGACTIAGAHLSGPGGALLGFSLSLLLCNLLDVR